MTFETRTDVTGLAFIVNTETIDDRNQLIASEIDFDYVPMVGQFYNCHGEPTSDFDTGYVAYQCGMKIRQMTSDAMVDGWAHAHGELMWDYAITAERDDVWQQRSGWQL